MSLSRVQLSPRSSLRNRPPEVDRSSKEILPVPPKSLSTTARSTFEFFGYSVNPMRPVRGGSPPASFFQVRPALSERKIPPVSLFPVNDQAVRRRAYIAA